MSRDQLIGWLMVTGAIIVILVYTWLMFFTNHWELLTRLTLVIAIIGVFGIIAWIGYTLATTPPPKPIEEIEKEIEEELRKLELETRQQQ
ncbi:MAG: transcriptional regulator [Desulfurococcaceae archaeon]